MNRLAEPRERNLRLSGRCPCLQLIFLFAGLKHGLHLREPDEREMAKWRKRGMFKHLDAPLALGPASISCPGKFEPPAEQAGDWSEPLLDDLAQSFICADTADEN